MSYWIVSLYHGWLPKRCWCSVSCERPQRRSELWTTSWKPLGLPLPAIFRKVNLLLMKEISAPVEVDGLSHQLGGFIYPRWCRISSNSSLPFCNQSFAISCPCCHAGDDKNCFIQPNFGRNMPKEEEEASSEVLEGCNHFAAAKNIFFSTSWSTPTDGVTGSSGVWSSPAELNKSVGDVSKSLSLSRGKEGKFVSRQIWIYK